MKKFAQIVGGKVHWIGEFKKLPSLHPSIEMIEITGREDIEEGWEFDKNNKLFKKPIFDEAKEARDLLAKMDDRGSGERVIEDLVDLLVLKEVIIEADLPQVAQDKLNKWRELRIKAQT